MRVPWTSFVVAGWVALLVGGAASAAPVALSSPSVPAAWASYNDGAVDVVLASGSPTVTLFQVSNWSVSVTVTLDAIAEIAPGSNGTLSSANLISTGATGAYAGSTSASNTFHLQGNLPVSAAKAPVWPPSAAYTPPNSSPTSGQATVSVNYTVPPPTSTATSVNVGWSVANWPWVSSASLLGVIFAFTVPSASALRTCSVPSSITESPPACNGFTVSPGSGTYVPGGSSVESENASGPIAALSWSTSASAGGSSATVTTGVWSFGPNVGKLVLEIPGHGAPLLRGSLGISLALPTGPLSPAIAHASALWVGLGVVGAVVASLGAVAYRRRRDRRIIEEL